jgi:hypothetical protein
VREQAEEEGYITGAKRDDRPRTEKEAQVGTDALGGKSLALILYGRFVSSNSFISSSPGQSLGRLDARPFIPPFTK